MHRPYYAYAVVILNVGEGGEKKSCHHGNPGSLSLWDQSNGRERRWGFESGQTVPGCLTSGEALSFSLPQFLHL